VWAPELTGGFETPDYVTLAGPVVYTEEGVAGYDTDEYRVVGVLTSEQLLSTTADQWEPLQELVISARDWVQKQLTSKGLGETVEHARGEPGGSGATEMVSLIDRLTVQWLTKETRSSVETSAYITAAVINEIIGLGPIQPLMDDPEITEVMVNGPRDIYVEISGLIVPVPGAAFHSQQHLSEICQRILRPLNKSVDQRNTMEDGRLPDGSRVNVVHNSVAPNGPTLTIRKFPEKAWTMIDLITSNSVTESMGKQLAWLVDGRCNILVVGGTGSGKTTTLNALTSCIPRNERIITIEDSLELRPHPDSHCVAMEARPPSAGGEGEVTIRDLVKNALRMRPTRIIVGEVRDGAALDMLQAMNTGHDGSLTTVHANSAHEAVNNRLPVMVSQGGQIPHAQVASLVASAVDIVIYQRRFSDGKRRIESVHQVLKPRPGERVEAVKLRPLWVWKLPKEIGGEGFYNQEHPLDENFVAMKGLRDPERFTLERIYSMSARAGEL
jgi:pilus assembly protein CpaF